MPQRNYKFKTSYAWRMTLDSLGTTIQGMFLVGTSVHSRSLKMRDNMDIIMATSQNLAGVRWLTIDQLDSSCNVVTEIDGETCIGELCDGGFSCIYPEQFFMQLQPIQKFCSLKNYVHCLVGGVPRTRDLLIESWEQEPETGLEMFLQRWWEEEEVVLIESEGGEPNCFFLTDYLTADLYEGVAPNHACTELLFVCQDMVAKHVHYVEETQQLGLRTWTRREEGDDRKTNIPPYWWLKQEGYVD